MILALGVRQEDCELQANLGYPSRPCLGVGEERGGEGVAEDRVEVGSREALLLALTEIFFPLSVTQELTWEMEKY